MIGDKSVDRRYRKRAFAHLARALVSARRSVERLDVHGWFDLRHTHIDWKSIGNRHMETRAEVARQTYALLRHAERHFLARTAALQIFATICEDTGSNAVYVHSANPNGTPFPQAFPGADWNVALPPELEGIVESAVYEAGEIHFRAEKQYIIRLRPERSQAADPASVPQDSITWT